MKRPGESRVVLFPPESVWKESLAPAPVMLTGRNRIRFGLANKVKGSV
jgi:hypothetical protein